MHSNHPRRRTADDKDNQWPFDRQHQVEHCREARVTQGLAKAGRKNGKNIPSRVVCAYYSVVALWRRDLTALIPLCLVCAAHVISAAVMYCSHTYQACENAMPDACRKYYIPQCIIIAFLMDKSTYILDLT